jgi:uncharacterized protein YunC (DUF1805 family)
MKMSKETAAELGALIAEAMHEGGDVAARGGALRVFYAIQDALIVEETSAHSKLLPITQALTNAFRARIRELEPSKRTA